MSGFNFWQKVSIHQLCLGGRASPSHPMSSVMSQKGQDARSSLRHGYVSQMSEPFDPETYFFVKHGSSFAAVNVMATISFATRETLVISVANYRFMLIFCRHADTGNAGPDNIEACLILNGLLCRFNVSQIIFSFFANILDYVPELVSLFSRSQMSRWLVFVFDKKIFSMKSKYLMKWSDMDGGW